MERKIYLPENSDQNGISENIVYQSFDEKETSSDKKWKQEQDVDEKDIDEILEEIGFGVYQIQLVVILAVGNVTDIVNFVLISFISPCAEAEMGLSTFQTSFLTGAVFIGAMLGAVVFGRLSDSNGRRVSYGLSLLMCGIFGVATYFTFGYIDLVIYRTSLGFGIGGAAVVPLVYGAEVVPVSVRGRASLAQSVFWAMSATGACLLGWWLLESRGWRLIALVVSIPTILGTLFLPTLTESPRWLLLQGRVQEAEQALRIIAKRNKHDLGKFSLKPMPPLEPRGDICSTMFSKNLIGTTLVLLGCWAIQTFNYYGIVLVITDDVFELSSGCSFDFLQLTISTLSEPIAVLLGILYIENGRRLAAAINYVLFGVFALFLGLNLPLDTLMVFAVLSRGAIRMGSSVNFAMTPEFYPTEVRSQAHSFMYTLSRPAGYLAPYWTDTSFSTEVIVALMAVTAFMEAGVIFLLKETAGVSMEESSMLTPPGSPRAKESFDSTRVSRTHSLSVHLL